MNKDTKSVFIAILDCTPVVIESNIEAFARALNELDSNAPDYGQAYRRKFKKAMAPKFDFKIGNKVYTIYEKPNPNYEKKVNTKG